MQIPKFVFVHIPRTGGGTINHIFRNNYKKNTIVLIYYTPTDVVRKFPGEEKVRIKGVHQVRNYPIILGHIPFKEVSSFKRTVITWLRHPVNRVISDYRRYKGKLNLIEFVIKNRNLMNYYTGGDLSKFDFIGITEFYDKDIERMFNFLDIELPSYKNIHVSTNKVEVTNDIRKEIKKLNEKDLELYKKALKMRNKK